MNGDDQGHDDTPWSRMGQPVALRLSGSCIWVSRQSSIRLTVARCEVLLSAPATFFFPGFSSHTLDRRVGFAHLSNLFFFTLS
jgi:hypothetical protein